MSITKLQSHGAGILAILDDGQRIICYPTPTGIWIPRRGSVAPNPEPVDPTDPPPEPGGVSPWKWPMNPDAINSRHAGGESGAYQNSVRPDHNGLDFSWPPVYGAGMAIRSIADGVVLRAYWEPGGGGYAVEVRHSARWISGYYHAVEGSFKVANGQTITQGTHLFDSGETGQATGPHLHFMIADMNKTGNYWTSHMDPELFMAEYNPNDEYV